MTDRLYRDARNRARPCTDHAISPSYRIPVQLGAGLMKQACRIYIRLFGRVSDLAIEHQCHEPSRLIRIRRVWRQVV
jgi:hypothetical protein